MNIKNLYDNYCSKKGQWLNRQEMILHGPNKCKIFIPETIEFRSREKYIIRRYKFVRIEAKTYKNKKLINTTKDSDIEETIINGLIAQDKFEINRVDNELLKKHLQKELKQLYAKANELYEIKNNPVCKPYEY